MLKTLLITLLITLTSACNLTKDNLFAPNKKLFKMLPEGPADYQLGWLDGCETGMATGFATDYYRYFYKFKKDIDMIKSGNKRYLRAWPAAMIYCRHYALGTLREATMQPLLPGTGYPPIPFGGETLFGTVFSPKNQGAIGLSLW
jgi:hypothetical protein